MQRQDCTQLTLFQGDSPASPFPLPGSSAARQMAVTSGRKCVESCVSCTPLGWSEKTLLESYELRLRGFFPTCKVSATRREPTVLRLGTWGGLHKGERIFIVAASDDRSAALRGDTQFPPNASTDGCRDNHRRRTAEPDLWERWEVEPCPYGVADGVPHRVDRLRCLGNAVVPQQAYPIFKAIAEVTR